MAIKKYQKLYYVYFCPPWNTYSKMLLLKIVRFFFWTYTHITSREKLENKGRGRTEIVNVVSGALRRIFFRETGRTEVLFIQHLKFFSLFFRYYYLPTCQTLFFRLLKGAKSSLLFTHWFKFLFDKKRFVKRKSNMTVTTS